MAAVQQRWSDLPLERREEITSTVLHLTGDHPTGFRSATAGADPMATRTHELLDLVESKLERRLRAPWTVKKAVPGESPHPAVTIPFFVNEKLAECITVVGDGFDALDELQARSVLAAEAYACLQVDAVGEGGLSAVPLWFLAGSQAWVGEMAADPAKGSTRSSSWWDAWLSEPELPIGIRTADAIGWFATVHAATGNAWGVLDAGLADPAGALAGMHRGALRQWAPRTTRRAALPGWDTVGPGVTDTRAQPVDVGSAIGNIAEVRPGAAWIGKLALEAPIVRLDVPPGASGELEVGGAVHAVDAPVTLCVTSKECTCPNGRTSVPGPSIDTAGNPVMVAIASLQAGKVTLTKVEPSCPEPANPTTSAVEIPTDTLDGVWKSSQWVFPPAIFGTASGGDGMLMTIVDDTIAVTFDSMQPVTLANSASGVAVETRFSYRGKAAGTLRVDPTTAAFTADYASQDLKVNINTFVDGSLIDTIDLSGDQLATRYGLAMPGTHASYELSEDQLVLSQPVAGQAMKIVFVRTG
jgi:hypothetical protein